MNPKNAAYFDSFGVGYIPKQIRKIIGNKNFITNDCRIQAYDLIMWRYFCMWFIDFMLKGKNLREYTNLSSPNKYQKNEKVILRHFQ